MFQTTNQYFMLVVLLDTCNWGWFDQRFSHQDASMRKRGALNDVCFSINQRDSVAPISRRQNQMFDAWYENIGYGALSLYSVLFKSTLNSANMQRNWLL